MSVGEFISHIVSSALTATSIVNGRLEKWEKQRRKFEKREIKRKERLELFRQQREQDIEKLRAEEAEAEAAAHQKAMLEAELRRMLTEKQQRDEARKKRWAEERQADAVNQAERLARYEEEQRKAAEAKAKKRFQRYEENRRQARYGTLHLYLHKGKSIGDRSKGSHAIPLHTTVCFAVQLRSSNNASSDQVLYSPFYGREVNPLINEEWEVEVDNAAMQVLMISVQACGMKQVEQWKKMERKRAEKAQRDADAIAASNLQPLNSLHPLSQTSVPKIPVGYVPPTHEKVGFGSGSAGRLYHKNDRTNVMGKIQELGKIEIPLSFLRAQIDGYFTNSLQLQPIDQPFQPSILKSYYSLSNIVGPLGNLTLEVQLIPHFTVDSTGHPAEEREDDKKFKEKQKTRWKGREGRLQKQKEEAMQQETETIKQAEEQKEMSLDDSSTALPCSPSPSPPVESSHLSIPVTLAVPTSPSSVSSSTATTPRSLTPQPTEPVIEFQQLQSGLDADVLLAEHDEGLYI